MNDISPTKLKDRDSDEIDIVELVLQLWRGKWMIALFILLGLAISGVWVMVTPAKWSSTAIITRPDSAQIARYTHALNVLEGGSTLNIQDLEARAINRFAVAFSALADTLHNQRQRENLSIEPLVKGQSLPLKVTYQTTSPEAAQAGLTDYIEQTNKRIGRDLDVDLRENRLQKLAALDSSLATQETIAQEQKDLRIKQIKEALKFAEAAKVTRPQDRQGDSATQDTLFLLGSEALTAMVERESMRPLAYPSSYFQMRQQLLEIKELDPDNINLSVYRYVLKPSLPIYKDGPRVTLSLVLGAMLGLFIGCGVVLGRQALRSYKQSH